MKKLFIIFLILFWAGGCFATDYYCVKTTGTKSSGVSTTDLSTFGWANVDCYATIASALAQSGDTDTVALYNETHHLASGATVTDAYITNQNDDEDYTNCIIDFSAETDSQMRPLTSLANAYYKGITFANADSNHTTAYFRILTNDGTGMTINYTGCKFTGYRGTWTQGPCITTGNVDAIVVNITRCVFDDNDTLIGNGLGGAIYSDDVCTFNILESTFSDNTTGVYAGGAIWQKATSATTLTISDCAFTNNISGRGSPNMAHGGAIYIDDYITLDIDDCTFTGNIAGRMGGAIGANGDTSDASRSTLDIDDCTFINNSATSAGGSIGATETDVYIDNCTFSGSSTGYDGYNGSIPGSAIFVQRNEDFDTNLIFSMSNSTVQNSTQDLSGSPPSGDGTVLTIGYDGVAEDANDLVVSTVINCVFKNNWAQQGAGFYCGRFANCTLSRCKFSGNTAWNGGATYKGGVNTQSGNLGLTSTYNSCIFYNNKAGYDPDGSAASQDGYGGAACTRLLPRMVFNNCSFYNNMVRAGSGDAIYTWDDSGSFDETAKQNELYNCIFWGTNGTDKQIVAGDSDSSGDRGYSSILNCAYESGELTAYADSGTTSTVTLTASPFDSNLKIPTSSPAYQTGTFITGFHDTIYGDQDYFGNPMFSPFSMGAHQGDVESGLGMIYR